ncbi:MAG: HupE/UreJ family protein, partial [Deltaproteobacteria bacterium]|nr:HupE/UreJ family protein [Deltaproteobacteria bacterium]
IFGGTDHILFLLALLLAAPLARRRGAGATTVTPGEISPGEGLSAPLALESGWRPGLVYLLKIVSTFTVAHSLTLAASGLGWVHLPSKLVESVIAASILWVALENMVLPSSRYRVALVFVFGLAHGFGFADVLAETGLPPAALVGALLSFNLGVEVGQLMIVGLAFPMIILMARVWAARGWSYRWVLRGGSAVVAVCGAYWLVTRLWA